MPRAFAEIAFTPSVRAFQAERGSAGRYDRLLADGPPAGDRLGPDEAAFVAACDGFYQATVSETGWPYVQFRGGPPSFLKVVDGSTFAYADFRGNRQYLSAGNLSRDDRVSLILMDYAERRRLKIWGHAALSTDPDIVADLHPAGYRARPERAVIVKVAAIDWNCPQHIPQRFSAAEVEARIAPLRQRITQLEAEADALRSTRATPA